MSTNFDTIDDNTLLGRLETFWHFAVLTWNLWNRNSYPFLCKLNQKKKKKKKEYMFSYSIKIRRRNAYIICMSGPDYSPHCCVPWIGHITVYCACILLKWLAIFFKGYSTYITFVTTPPRHLNWIWPLP